MNQFTPLVTIVIPVFNREWCLSVCLESVVRQTYTNLQIIVVDDGSTDNSYVICQDYQKRDKRIICIKTENGGPGRARNIGISQSCGKYITFIDSDDSVDRDYIRKMVEAAEKNNADLVVCNIYDVYTRNNVKQMRQIKGTLTGEFNKDFILLFDLLKNVAIKLFKMDIIRYNKIKFNTNIFYGEDQLFNLDYYRYVKQYAYIDEPCYYYYHRTNIVNSYNEHSFMAMIEKIKKEKCILKEIGIIGINNILNLEIVCELRNSIIREPKKISFKEFCERVQIIRPLLMKNSSYVSLKNKIIIFFLKQDFILPLFVYYSCKRWYQSE